MARMLDVYLHEHLVGHLIQDDGGQIDISKAGWHNRARPQSGLRRCTTHPAF